MYDNKAPITFERFMPGIPILHLSPSYAFSDPSPVPPPDPLLTTRDPLNPLAAPVPSPPLRRRKSILKKMAIPITWDQPHPSNTPPAAPITALPPLEPHKPAKLHKSTANVARHVHFPAQIPLDEAAPLIESPTAVQAAGTGKGKKKSLVSKVFGQNNASSSGHVGTLPLPSPQLFDSTEPKEHLCDGWTHHPAYFPEYEPINPTPPTGPSTAQPTYFPDYSPIYSPSHPIHAYPSGSAAFTYALTQTEKEMMEGQSMVNRSIIIHYPDLPRFAKYQSTVKGSGGTWQGGKWGVEGWTGYGWTGEKLPNDDGLTFGAPMPKGVEIPKEDGGGKKKKGKGKGDGEGGDGEGGEGEGEGEGGEGGDGEKAEAEAAPAEGEGGEGSKKKKNKKKKKK